MMNQIISDLFHQTSSPLEFLDALKALKEKNLVVTAFTELLEANSRLENLQEVYDKYVDLPIENESPEVYLMFLLRLYGNCSFREASEQAKVYQRKIHEVAPKITSPELKAEVDMRMSTYDKHTSFPKVVKTILEHVPKSSKRYSHYLSYYCKSLSMMGRAMSCQTELFELQEYRDNVFTFMNLAYQFIDDTQAGRFKIAAPLYDHIVNSFPKHLEADVFYIRVYLDTAKLLMDILSARRTAKDIEIELDTQFQIDCACIQALLKGQPESALKMSRNKEKKRNYPLGSFDSIGDYTHIRCELANRNISAAEELLTELNTFEHEDYMIPFFKSRLYWQKGERDAAIECFGRCHREMERFNALGRLQFELSMASELDYLDIVQLGKGLANPASKATHRPNITKARNEKNSEDIIGNSPALQNIRHQVEQYARLDMPVLITGETGSGKDLVARSLHSKSSRSQAPFLAINCASISDNLLASELFGHVKGAFSGAINHHPGIFLEAGEGTLFLDEIGDISEHIQVSLLRVLEQKEIRAVGSSAPEHVRCRVIAATNVDLEEKIRQGAFRMDLYYRLKRLELDIPPLAERIEDMSALIDHFLNPEGTPLIKSFNNAALLLMQNYNWPGNVRELKNEVEKIALLNPDTHVYTESHLPNNIRNRQQLSTEPERAAPTPLNPAAKLQGSNNLIQHGRTALRRREHLLDQFKHHKVLTRLEIIQHTGLAPKTVTKDLHQLIDDGFLKKIEPSKSPRSHYFELVET